MTYAISVNNLDVSYDNNKVLYDINVDIPINCRCAIVGANGAGKSTLIKSILGFVKKDTGTIKIFNKDIKKSRLDIAYVPQRDSVNRDFPITVYDVVKMGRYPYIPFGKSLGSEDKKIIDRAITQMGISELKDRQINKLSGGQKQRVFLARALAQNVDLYILDEPLTGVDVKTQDIIEKEFKNLQKIGKTIVSVHHNIYTLKKYFDYIIILNKDVKYAGVLDVDNIKEYLDLGFRG